MRWTGRGDRWDWLAVGGLLLIGVGLPVIVGAVAGTLDIPRNDDWAYRRMALELARTGELVLVQTRAMIIGQLLIAQPFLWLSAHQPWGFAAAGVFFASGCVLGAYGLARQFLSPPWAIVPVLLLLIAPGYLAYATSFMSDGPAIAAQLACLALGAVALRRQSLRDRWLLGSIAVGCVGVSIRDFALAAPAAVVLAAICANPRRVRYWVLAATVGTVYGLLSLLRIVLTVPGDASDLFAGGVEQSLQALALLSLVLAPAAVIGAIGQRGQWRRIDVMVGVEIGAILVGVRLVPWFAGGELPLAILPNVASQWGAPLREMFLGDRPALFPDALWAVINLTALAASVLVLAVAAGVLGARLRRCGPVASWTWRGVGSPGGLLAIYCLAVVVGLGVFGLNTQLFDRYFWALIPAIAIVLLRTPPPLHGAVPPPASRGQRFAALGVVPFTAFLACLAVVYQLNASAFDGARWKAGETLVQAGVRADEVDAGYEWVGYFATVPATGGGTSPVRYRRIFAGFRQCGWVTSAAATASAAELVATQDYALFLIAGPAERLYLYRSTDPACLTR